MTPPLSDHDHRVKTCVESLHLASLVWGVIKSPTLREELDESFKTFSILQKHFLKKLAYLSDELGKSSLGANNSSASRRLKMLERLNLSGSDLPDHGYQYSHEYIFGGRLKGVFSGSTHSVRTVYKWAMMLSMVAGGWIRAEIVHSNGAGPEQFGEGRRHHGNNPKDSNEQKLGSNILDNNIMESHVEFDSGNKQTEDLESFMLQNDDGFFQFELQRVNLDDSRLVQKDVEKRVPAYRKIWVRTLLDIFSNWHTSTTEMMDKTQRIIDPEIAKEFDSDGYLEPLFKFTDLEALIDHKRVFSKLIKPHMKYQSDGSGLSLKISKRTIEVLLRAEQSQKVETELRTEDEKLNWHESNARNAPQKTFYCQEEVTSEMFLMWILGNAMIPEEEVYLKLSDVVHHYTSSVMDSKFYTEFLQEVNSADQFEGFYEGFLQELTTQPAENPVKQSSNPLEREWMDIQKNQIRKRMKERDTRVLGDEYVNEPAGHGPKSSGKHLQASEQKGALAKGVLPTLNERAPSSEGSNSGERVDRQQVSQSRTQTEESMAIGPVSGWKKQSQRSMIEAETSKLNHSQPGEDSLFDEDRPMLNKLTSDHKDSNKSSEVKSGGDTHNQAMFLNETGQNEHMQSGVDDPQTAQDEPLVVPVGRDMHHFSVNQSDASIQLQANNKIAPKLQTNPNKAANEEQSGVDNSVFDSSLNPFGLLAQDSKNPNKGDSYMNFTIEREKDELEAEDVHQEQQIVVGNESGQLDDSHINEDKPSKKPVTSKSSEKMIQETESANDTSEDDSSSGMHSKQQMKISTFEDWWCAKLGLRSKSDYDLGSRAYTENPIAYKTVFEHALHLGMIRELALDVVNKYLTPASQTKILLLEEFFQDIRINTVEDTEFIAHSINTDIRNRLEDLVKQFLKTLSNTDNSEIDDAKNTSEALEDSDADIENILQIKRPSQNREPQSEGGLSASAQKRIQEEKEHNLQVVEKVMSLYLRNQFPKDLESQLTKLVTLPPELLDPHMPVQDEETMKVMKRILRACKLTLKSIPAIVPNLTRTKVKLHDVQWTREARELCADYSQEAREFWDRTIDNMLELCEEVITPGNVATKKDAIYERAEETLRKLAASQANKQVNPNMRMGLNSEGYPVPGDSEKHKWFPVRRFKPEFRDRDEDSVVSKRIWAKVWQFVEFAHWKVQSGFVTWYALMVDGAEWEEPVNTILTRMGFSEVRTIEAAIKLMSILSEVSKSSYADFPAKRIQELNQIPWWVFSGCDHIFGYLEFESSDISNWKAEFLENLAEWLIQDQQEYYSGCNLDYDMEVSLDSFLGKFRDTYSMAQPIAHFKDRTPLENRNPDQEQQKLKEFREGFTFQLNKDFLIKKGLKRSNGTIKW